MKTPEEIGRYRLTLQEQFGKLLGVKYKFGAEWVDRSKQPEALDCSEAVEGVFILSGLPMKDGAQSQFDFTLALPDGKRPQPGDLGFFAHGKDFSKVYHVGMVYDAVNMIEARGYDQLSKFKTGEVILRPIDKWIKWGEFAGFRVHPELV